MPTSIEAQGHTIDEAIQIALNQLGVSRDKVEIEILHHPRRGVLGIGARRAKVRATIRESVMLDGEEFDMSGGESLDDKPRRRRRRGGRSRGGARGEEGAEATDGAARSASPRPDGGREGARPDGGRGRDDAGRQREGRRDDRREDRRGGRGRGGERSGDAQQRGGQQQRGAQQGGRGQGGRQDRPQDRSQDRSQDRPQDRQQDRPQDRGERTERQGQDRQDRQGRGRGGEQRRDREDRGPRGDRPSQQAPLAPEDIATAGGRAALPQPPPEPVLSAPPAQGAISAPELPSALPPVRRPAPADEAPLDAEALEAIRARAEELVRELLAKMGFAAEISSSVDEAAGEAVVSVRSDSEGLLIGRRGQTLDSLEHIINRMVLRGEAYVEGRVQLDIGDYRKRRRESLEELAGRLRARAVSEQRTVQVSPMSPRDRRYFSLAFAGDEAVEVRALGAGFYRRVIVAPAGMGGSAPSDQGRDVEDVEDTAIDAGAAPGLEAEH